MRVARGSRDLRAGNMGWGRVLSACRLQGGTARLGTVPSLRRCDEANIGRNAPSGSGIAFFRAENGQRSCPKGSRSSILSSLLRRIRHCRRWLSLHRSAVLNGKCIKNNIDIYLTRNGASFLSLL